MDPMEVIVWMSTGLLAFCLSLYWERKFPGSMNYEVTEDKISALIMHMFVSFFILILHAALLHAYYLKKHGKIPKKNDY